MFANACAAEVTAQWLRESGEAKNVECLAADPPTGQIWAPGDD